MFVINMIWSPNSLIGYDLFDLKKNISQDTSEERRVYVFINPMFNNGDNSDPQSSQHQFPKWGI